jgi:curli production assembly/transport component CsgE
LLAFGFSVSVCAAQAQAPSAAAASSSRADPYAGVVADGTITFVGQEFYRHFAASWRDQARVERYSLSILERPSARWGSLVWIEFANRRVFSAFLSPGRRDRIRAVAEEAVQTVYQNVVDSEVQRLLFKDPDLAADEF